MNFLVFDILWPGLGGMKILCLVFDCPVLLGVMELDRRAAVAVMLGG